MTIASLTFCLKQTVQTLQTGPNSTQPKKKQHEARQHDTEHKLMIPRAKTLFILLSSSHGLSHICSFTLTHGQMMENTEMKLSCSREIKDCFENTAPSGKLHATPVMESIIYKK